MTQGIRRDITDDFRREAVRLTQTSGRTIKQVADDLGIGLSTLTRWKRKYDEADLLSGPHDDVEKGGVHIRPHMATLRAVLEVAALRARQRRRRGLQSGRTLPTRICAAC